MIKKVLKTFLSIPVISHFATWFLYLFKKKEQINESECNINVLNSFKPDIGCSCILEDKISFKNNYDLAVIVPCFNSEKYIEKCAHSLLNQKTKYRYQIIFVDDGSSDGTLKALKDICSEINFVTILHQNNNGASSARNLGIKHSSAAFLTFVDSDDYLCNEFLIDNLISLLKEKDPSLTKPIIAEYNFIKDNGFKVKNKKGKLKETSSLNLKGFACGKVYSSSFFSRICFPEHYNYEDSINALILFPMSNKIYTSNIDGYFYLEREDNSTQKAFKSEAVVDTFYVTKKLLEDASKLGIINQENYVNLVMRQVVCNYKRLIKADPIIQKSVFAETRKLVQSIGLLSDVNLKYFNVHKSIQENNYKLYRVACSIIR